MAELTGPSSGDPTARSAKWRLSVRYLPLGSSLERHGSGSDLGGETGGETAPGHDTATTTLCSSSRARRQSTVWSLPEATSAAAH